MEKKDLIKILDEIFVPIGLKKKGNNWVQNGEVISKIINLQKSIHGNSYYINYGFIINKLKLTTTTHIENRLAANNTDEQKRITNLLDFDNDITLEVRITEIKNLIIDKIVSKILAINKEEDLLNELQKRPHLNDIPLVVKKHFNLL